MAYYALFLEQLASTILTWVANKVGPEKYEHLGGGDLKELRKYSGSSGILRKGEEDIAFWICK